MTLFLEKHALGSLLKAYRRTENGHVTQHRMEESQGGLPGGDAASVVYSYKSMVLGGRVKGNAMFNDLVVESLACSKIHREFRTLCMERSG